MNLFKRIFKRKKKTTHYLLVLKKSIPKYYGLCGREIIIHKIPMGAHDDDVFKLAAYLDYGFKIDRVELSEQPLNTD